MKKIVNISIYIVNIIIIKEQLPFIFQTSYEFDILVQ